MKHRELSILLLLGLTGWACAKELLIEDFSAYGSSEQLQSQWNAFGNAASSGPATLDLNSGRNKTHTALFQLNWDAGDNANMRLKSLPTGKQDLSEFDAVEVVLMLSPDAAGFSSPDRPTSMRLVVQGGPDGSIWQTDSSLKTLPQSKHYQTIIFKLSENEMVRESGSSSLRETLSQVSNLRLRFENLNTAGVRQDVYIDTITAKD